jgi:uncharacterized protein (TIGR02145 family)
MRKSSLILVVTLVAAMFAGCVKEYTGNVDSDGYTYEKGTVSFALPPAGEKVTYTRADAVTGEDDLDNLVIYQFAADNKLEAVYATGNITLPGAEAIAISGSTNKNRIATIKVGTTATGKRTFYLVANVNGTSNSARSAKLWSDVQQTPALGTSITTFEGGLVTDDLTDVMKGGLKETDAVLALETPLPMSNMIDLVNTGTGVVVADVAAPGYNEVTLKRRVARFDIVNHKEYTNLEVTGVVVKKGKLSGEILDKALLNYSLEAGDKDGEKVLANANGTGTINPAMDYNTANNPGSKLNVSGLIKSLNPAQFYLYPTKVAADGSATEIYLTGKFKGVPHVYPLTLTGGLDVDIEANYVYQIIVNRATNDKYTFTLLKVAPWEDYTGDVIESGVSDEFETFSNLKNKNDADKGVDHEFSDAEAGDNDLELHVEYKSMSATPPVLNLESVVRADGGTALQTLVEDAIKVVAEDPVLTRAALGSSVYYTHVITITLAQPVVPAKAELTISHPELGQLQKYTFSSIGRYPESGEKPVLVAGIYWAPTNVGATTLVHSFSAVTPAQLTTARVGYYFQWGRTYARFENTTTVPVYLLGPVTATEAAGIYANSLIRNETPPNDWLTPKDDDLWSDANPQGPCPAGWQVPTRDDFMNTFTNTSTPLAPNYISNELATSHIVIVSGDDSGTSLYLPGASYIHSGSGELDMDVDAAIYWTRTTHVNGKSYRYCITSTDNGASITITRHQPYNVRCILAD